MAYVSKEKKEKIVAQLKKVVPKSWKYTVSVNHHSTICFNLKSAPVPFTEILNARHRKWTIERNARLGWANAADEYANSNHFEIERLNIDEVEGLGDDVKAVIKAISAALNIDNFDKSDIMTDYFHVGHYVRLNIGRWNQPYINSAAVEAEAVAA